MTFETKNKNPINKELSCDIRSSKVHGGFGVRKLKGGMRGVKRREISSR